MARYDSINEILCSLETQSITLGNPVSLPAKLPVVEALWQAAQSVRSQNRFDEAAILCQKLLEFSPSHVPALTMLAALQAAYQQAQTIYDSIESQLESVDLNDLVYRADEADHIYPEHPAKAQVITRLLPRFNRYRQAVIESAASSRCGDNRMALRYIEEAWKANPGSLRIPMMIEMLQERMRISG